MGQPCASHRYYVSENGSVKEVNRDEAMRALQSGRRVIVEGRYHRVILEPVAPEIWADLRSEHVIGPKNPEEVLRAMEEIADTRPSTAIR